MAEKKPEEKAIPEWMIVKREILQTFYNCAELFGQRLKMKRWNQNTKSIDIDIESLLVVLYKKNREMIKEKSKLHELNNGHKKSFEKCSDYFDMFADLLKKRGITKIEREKVDHSW